MKETQMIDTTVGELIAALWEETVLVVSDKQTSCRVVSYILTDLLRRNNTRFKTPHARQTTGIQAKGLRIAEQEAT